MFSNSAATLCPGTQEGERRKNGRRKSNQKNETGNITYLNPSLQRKGGREGGKKEVGRKEKSDL